MYAGIRQAKAKTGMVEELTRRIKEGAIPLVTETAPTDHPSPAGHPPTVQPDPPHPHPADPQPRAATVTHAKPACPLNWEDTSGSSVNRP